MKPWGFLVGLLSFAAAILAQEPAGPSEASRERAVELLMRSRAALASHRTVRYRARIVPRGIGEKFWPAAEGVAVLSGWDATLRRPQRFHFDLETRRGAAAVKRVSGGSDGDTFFVVDYDSNKSYRDMDPLVLGSHGQTLARFEMTEFVMPEPFADELAARELVYVGSREHGGQDCFEIHVQYSGGRGEATWLLASDDFLPRWRIQKFSIPQGEGSLEFEILELDLDPVLPQDFFSPQTPAGVVEVDDFAP